MLSSLGPITPIKALFLQGNGLNYVSWFEICLAFLSPAREQDLVDRTDSYLMRTSPSRFRLV